MRVLLVLISLFTFSTIQAQSIRLSGKVSNQRNEPVSGVTIRVKGIAGGTSTDIEGRYSIQLNPGTSYTIEVSAVGFTSKDISDVDVKSGQDNELNIILETAPKQIQSVTVTSVSRRQENTASLLSFQKNNSALSSGLAADFIRRTPDKNTGEVLRRVSGTSVQDNKYVIVRGLGDRYNSAYLNGAALASTEPDKKAFSFDVIPSALIDNVIINKTATPDITGEFAGGLIQIQTKDIPSSSQLMVGMSLGFNTQSVFNDFISNERSSTDFLGFSKNRDLPASYPKKYLDYSRLPVDERMAIARSFKSDVYNETTTTAAPIQQYNLTWANVKRFKNGAALGSVLGVTYRQSKLMFDATKSLYEKGDNGQEFFDYNDRQNKYSVNVGVVANIAWTYKKNKIAFKNLYNQLLEDNYYNREGINTENLQDVRLRSSVLNQRSLYSAQLEGSHELPVKKIRFNWNLNVAMNDKSQPDLRVQTYGKTIGVDEPYRINLRGNNTNRFFSDLSDKAYGYSASLSMPFTLGQYKQTIKVGGAATVRLRDFSAYIFGYAEPSDPALNILPYNEIFKPENIREGGFQMITDLQNPQDKYYGVSALSAGYVMLDNKLSDKFRLVWGSRFEYFEQFLKSNIQGSDKAQVVNTDQFDFLPSLNLTYSPNNKTNIRLAGSRTVARPEFREIAPFAFFDFEQIASTAGSPGLKRSSIINVDVRYELYPKAGEVLSLGAFYKSFTDPIELRLNSASVATRRQYEFQNASDATLFGVEAEFRKSLGFLNTAENSWLKNLYFNGNVSVIFSEVNLGNVDASGQKLPSTSRPLQGQSPYLINAGFQYDGKKGTSLSLLYNRIGERLTLVGNADFGDIYEKPRNLVDFQASQKILKNKGELRLTVSDIFNQAYATFENRDSKKTFNASSDRYFSRFNPGTTITIGFNYNFDL